MQNLEGEGVERRNFQRSDQDLFIDQTANKIELSIDGRGSRLVTIRRLDQRMYWRCAIASRQNGQRLRRNFDGHAAIHEHETIVDEKAIWIESRPVLQKSLWVGIDRCGQRMRRPAFQKNFATRDARTRFKI